MDLRENVTKYTKIVYDEQLHLYKGQCPFCHGETETFIIDNEHDMYVCYGCGEIGNMKKFIQKKEGIRIPIPDSSVPELLPVYKKAQQYYAYLLKQEGNEGRKYLEKRNIKDKAIERFGLGYAPFGHRLYDFLKKCGFSDELIFSSKLCKKSIDGNEIYDFFRNRVMFPIYDGHNDVIAFGGRILTDEKSKKSSGKKVAPKYINSADTPLFSKRKILYGYPYMIPEGKKRANSIVICEGYMDLIAMKRVGLNDCAAVLGTAVTEDHAKRIATDYKAVFLALDSDEAGTSAMLSSINTLRDYGLKVYVMKYNTKEHPAKDGDELIMKCGKDAFLSVLKEQTKADFFIARHESNMDRFTDLIVKLDREGFEPKKQ
ncbi:MAG: toprim domain-containing protein [Lachnospiraceae bacterium]|nr:toprim domain-containing protein [Lachnospiraceae bacterium]